MIIKTNLDSEDFSRSESPATDPNGNLVYTNGSISNQEKRDISTNEPAKSAAASQVDMKEELCTALPCNLVALFVMKQIENNPKLKLKNKLLNSAHNLILYSFKTTKLIFILAIGACCIFYNIYIS